MGRKEGVREGEMWACLIQWPVLVTCPSAQYIGRKEEREGREDRNTGPLLTTTLSQEPEASATAGNFPHSQAM